MTKKINKKVLAWKWVARVVAVIYVAVILAFSAMEIILPHAEGSATLIEFIPLLFMPVALVVGLLVGWWRQFWGGLISILGVLAFYLSLIALRGSTLDRSIIFTLLILIIPGVLYLISHQLGSCSNDRS